LPEERDPFDGEPLLVQAQPDGSLVVKTRDFDSGYGLERGGSRNVALALEAPR